MKSVGSEKQMQVVFSGRVQGVGFRYSVCEIARDFGITGFVRNLWDGDVELIAEGYEEDLNRFFSAILNSRLDRYILNNRVSWHKRTGKFDRFGISS